MKLKMWPTDEPNFCQQFNVLTGLYKTMTHKTLSKNLCFFNTKKKFKKILQHNLKPLVVDDVVTSTMLFVENCLK